MPTQPLRLGIDLGGTKTEIIALDEQGQILLRKRVATPRHDYQASLRSIAQLVRAVEQQLNGRGSVGIAMPGAISLVSGMVKNANSVWLNGKPLQRDLELELKRPLRFANDADCFALSEASDGAAQHASSVFGVILGTGVGAGIVINGRLLAGPNRIAGEWGHNPLPWPALAELPGPDCYCGLQGCIETWLSGPGLAQDHWREHAQRLSAQAIVAGAEAGDVNALASLRRYEARLARALAHVINIVDPETIVLGGGLSNIKRLYEHIPKLWTQHIFSDHISTQLVAPVHGDSSGVRGAAWLWAKEQIA